MEKYEREILLEMQKQLSQVVKDMAYLVGKMEGIEKYESRIDKNTKDIDSVGEIARNNRSEIQNVKEEVEFIKKKMDSQDGLFKKIVAGTFTVMGSAIIYLAKKLGIF